MTNSQSPSLPDLAGDVGGALTALSTVLFAAFPFAVPLIVLLTAVAVLLLIPVLALGLVAALAAGPVLLVRRLARRARRRSLG